MSSPFAAPDAAVAIRPLPARLFLIGINVLGVALALTVHGTRALWPTPAPAISVAVLAALVAVTNAFGTFQNLEGLAEYASLAMPVSFAMLLLLDWRAFVAATVLGEILTFVSEVVRRVNPTTWYVRCFNASALVTSGAAAAGILALVRPLVDDAAGSWSSPVLALALAAAAIVWKIVDSAASGILLQLAAGRGIAAVKMPVRAFAAQFAPFSVAVPFAWAWHANVWLSAFALASLGVAYRMLGVPELEHRARTDARTGLVNAEAFERELETALDDTRASRAIALIAVDIDHFKSINDTFGHLIGDAVIERFAGLLAEEARRADVVARTGGEEFAILMRDVDRAGARTRAERLRRRIEAEAFHADDLDGPLALTASIGIAVSPDDGRTARELRLAADAALYAAKAGGRNMVRAAGMR